MIAKGKDCSDLFPAVVKNVVSKESEVSDGPPYTHTHAHHIKSYSVVVGMFTVY